MDRAPLTQVTDEASQGVLFPCLPEVGGQIEGQGLNSKEHGDPLVVFLVVATIFGDPEHGQSIADKVFSDCTCGCI